MEKFTSREMVLLHGEVHIERCGFTSWEVHIERYGFTLWRSSHREIWFYFMRSPLQGLSPCRGGGAQYPMSQMTKSGKLEISNLLVGKRWGEAKNSSNVGRGRPTSTTIIGMLTHHGMRGVLLLVNRGEGRWITLITLPARLNGPANQRWVWSLKHFGGCVWAM